MAAEKTLKLRLGGRVQGVGLRWSALRLAERLGVRGYVRNCRGGDVEAVAQGPVAAVDAFAEEMRRGPGWSKITRFEQQDMDDADRYVEFSVRYTR